MDRSQAGRTGCKGLLLKMIQIVSCKAPEGAGVASQETWLFPEGGETGRLPGRERMPLMIRSARASRPMARLM